jgi:alkylation response protein AidB-like acyl-CoA dehydrogenase
MREYQFLLEDVFDMYKHYEKLGAGESVNKELVDTLMDECGKLCTGMLFPLYTSGDSEGCHLLPDGTVTTPKGFKEAYQAIVDGGWVGINNPEEYGGQGLPQSIGVITREMMGTANWPLLMYPGLSAGAANTLLSWGSEEQKELYLKKIVEGKWSGTMCLTEPHCGTDLAQVKTRAEPQADGTFRLNGTKIFISAGDHDMSENIVHIVLARLPDSPPGTKGISLFVVPRHLVRPDGSLAAEKNVKCSGLEVKMGIKGSATCQMSFDNSVGYIIGAPNEGMKQMFTFMNAARLGTAIQGVAHAELAFQNALSYARERRSMRALSGTKEPEKVADLIIAHANIRHKLLFMKAVAEGGRALCMDLARLLDLYDKADDPAKKKAIDGEIGFYTPIAKACLTEWGLEAANLGVQCWGGHGFIKGNGMEQIVRDARISTLYEGTTAIQALDFIGRKVLKSKSNEVARFAARVNGLCKEHLFSSGVIGKHARTLYFQQKKWRMMTLVVGANAMKDMDNVAAAAEDFLMYSGLIVLGYYWLRMGIVASQQIKAGKDTDGFYQSKLDTCDFYFSRVFPRSDSHCQVMMQPAGIVMKSKQESWDL